MNKYYVHIIYIYLYVIYQQHTGEDTICYTHYLVYKLRGIINDDVFHITTKIALLKCVRILHDMILFQITAPR